MNILLINGPSHEAEKAYPLSLGSVAAVLKQEGHQVCGVDLSFSTTKECLDVIQRNHCALIGMLISHHNSAESRDFIDWLKSNSNIPVVALGSYPSAVGITLFEQADIDYLINGDPEYSFLELANLLSAGRKIEKVTGISSRAGDQVYLGGRSMVIKDLNALPFADRTLFPLGQYRGMVTKNRNYTQILTSRGCPHHCSYCVQIHGKATLSQRSAKSVVDEIEMLQERFDVDEIHIEDANFIAGNTDRVKDICHEMIRRGIHIDWQCPGVLPLFELKDLSLIDLMAEAGCYNVSIGVESFNAGIAAKFGRVHNLNLLDEIIQRCRKNRMEISCHMMIGFPGQTIDEMRRDIRQSRIHPFDFIHYNVYRHIPRGDHECSAGDSKLHSLLQNTQRSAYRALTCKWSVIRFVFRRFIRPHNLSVMLKKACYYLFSDKRHYLVLES